MQYIRGNGKYFAVSARGGGGPVLVLPYSAVGKLPRGYPLINGHSAAVLDTAWNPFNDNILATGSDDATVRVCCCEEERRAAARARRLMRAAALIAAAARFASELPASRRGATLSRELLEIARPRASSHVCALLLCPLA